jgi:hypothetical protein
LTQWGSGSIPILDWGKFDVRNPGHFLGERKMDNPSFSDSFQNLEAKTVEESEIKWKVAHFSAPFFTATQIR